MTRMLTIGPDRCPDCRYDLRGLPGHYHCPECGFEFDEHTLVCRPNRTWKAYLWLLPGVLVLCGPIAGMFSDSLRVGDSFSATATAIMAAALVGLCVLITWRLVRADRAGRYIALTPRGVKSRSLEGTQFVPWADVYCVSRMQAHSYVIAVERVSDENPIIISEVVQSRLDLRTLLAVAPKLYARYYKPQTEHVA